MDKKRLLKNIVIGVVGIAIGLVSWKIYSVINSDTTKFIVALLSGAIISVTSDIIERLFYRV